MANNGGEKRNQQKRLVWRGVASVAAWRNGANVAYQ
jgi:hypothetical protein